MIPVLVIRPGIGFTVVQLGTPRRPRVAAAASGGRSLFYITALISGCITIVSPVAVAVPSYCLTIVAVVTVMMTSLLLVGVNLMVRLLL